MPRFEADYSTFVKRESGEPLTEGTKKIYRAALNKIARYGFTDKAALLANPDDVLDAIHSLTNDDGKKRLYLSAIFKVLSDVDIPTKQKYYDAFQKLKTYQPLNGPAFID